MTLFPDDKLHPPTPEMLAAYVDGEFEANPYLLKQKEIIETWLDQNPKALHEINQFRQIKKAWEATTPIDPGSSAWNDCLDRIRAELEKPAVPVRRFPMGLAGGLAAASVLLAGLSLTFYFLNTRPDLNADKGIKKQKQKETVAVKKDIDPFPVIAEEDVEILYISGQDLETVVVGMPIEGPLEMPQPGEVVVTDMDSQDDMYMSETEPPMVWAKLETDQWE